MSLYSLNPHPASARLSPPRIVTLPQPGSPRPGPHPASAAAAPPLTVKILPPHPFSPLPFPEPPTLAISPPSRGPRQSTWSGRAGSVSSVRPGPTGRGRVHREKIKTDSAAGSAAPHACFLQSSPWHNHSLDPDKHCAGGTPVGPARTAQALSSVSTRRTLTLAGSAL